MLLLPPLALPREPDDDEDDGDVPEAPARRPSEALVMFAELVLLSSVDDEDDDRGLLCLRCC